MFNIQRRGYAACVLVCAMLVHASQGHWLGLTSGPFFDFKRQSTGLIKFYNETQGPSKWPNQFRMGWSSQTPCAWDGNERAHPAPWGTRCTTGGWHPAPPRGDGGLLYLEHYSGFAEGPVPREFDSFQTTDVIGLGHNKLNGPIWDTQYHTFLHRLDLAHNEMSGTLPENFMQRNVIHCELVNLYDNQFSGTIPVIMNTLTTMTALLLGKNQFSGSVPDLSNLKKMRQLDLSDNKFTGTIGPWLKELDNLAWVFLQGNQFEGALPQLPPKVSRVIVGGNKWKGRIPDSYGALGYLRVFNCTGCTIECPTPDFLQHVYFSTHCKKPKW
jgi:hypothetical protein